MYTARGYAFMTYATEKELRHAISEQLKLGEYHEAARIIVENSNAITPWFVNWAMDLISGVKPSPPNLVVFMGDMPLLKDGDLFWEPLTTGKRSRKRKQED
jgi:hypothetical protein